MVSGQVVNTLNFPPPTISTSNSTPVDLPIQLICPNLTRSAKFVSSNPFNKSSE